MNYQVDLGVTVSNKLSWTEQCSKLVSKANSRLGLVMRICHFTIDKKQKRTFYLTLVRSIFEHCSIIWHPTSSNQISNFEAVQKRAIKWIDGRMYDHYSDDQYLKKLKDFNILPLKLKFIMTDLTLFYKIIHSLVYISLPVDFTVAEPTQVRYTRNTANIVNCKDNTSIKCSIKPKCDSFRNSFFFRTMSIWNRIPCEIRQVDKISSFKLQLKKFMWTADTDWPD